MGLQKPDEQRASSGGLHLSASQPRRLADGGVAFSQVLWRLEPPLPFHDTCIGMVIRPTLFFWSVAALTAAGIYAIHSTQVEEREVSCSRCITRCAASIAAFHLAPPLLPRRSALLHLHSALQKLHMGVIRDEVMYKKKKAQMLAGELHPAQPSTSR